MLRASGCVAAAVSTLGLFLRLLAVERRDLGAMLLDAAWRDKPAAVFTWAGLAPAGGLNSVCGSSAMRSSRPATGQSSRRAADRGRSRCALPRAVLIQSGSSRSMTQGHRRPLTLWRIGTLDARGTTPVSNGWISLTRPLGTTLPVAGAYDVDMLRQAQIFDAQAEARPISVAPHSAADRRRRASPRFRQRRRVKAISSRAAGARAACATGHDDSSRSGSLL